MRRQLIRLCLHFSKINNTKNKQEYYAEDEFDDAHIAERATDILDNLAEIFGSDEQED